MEFLAKFSHREYRTRLAWMAEEHNRPSRTDDYIRQLTGVVDHLMSNSHWELDNYKIEYRVGPPSPEDQAQSVARAKAAWNRRTGKRNGD